VIDSIWSAFMIRGVLTAVLAIVPLFAQHNELFWPRERHLQFGAPFAWPQTTAASAPGTEVTHSQVLQLVKELFENDISPIYNIDQFRFVPLERGKISLVVVGDNTGRDFFNDIISIECAGTTCYVDSAPSDQPNDLSDQLIDPDGEGIYKMVTKRLVLGYQGAATKPIFTYSILKLKSGAKYSPVSGKIVVGPDLFDVTADYANYYTTSLLPKIERAKLGLEEKYGHGEGLAEARAAAEFAYDDYRRRILRDPKAGFQNAISWLDSTNREVQKLGISSLEAIDDNAAEQKLRELARSKDSEKAEEAKSALIRRAERKSGLRR
jgi:hypothetical protein